MPAVIPPAKVKKVTCTLLATIALAITGREAFAQVQQEWTRIGQEIQSRSRAKSFHVLARAMRADDPALVFAHAASIGEVDPLTDPESRLFVGLPAKFRGKFTIMTT